MISDSQLPKKYRDVIDAELSIFKNPVSVTEVKTIPDTNLIPIANPSEWKRIRDVICVYVDMKGSTKLSAETSNNDIAAIYRLFTSTAIMLFHEFDSPYIDVKGDGVFALFNANQAYTALCAAVTFKTFASNEFMPKVKTKTEEDIGYHIGIDQKTILVRKLGLKRVDNRTDRQNEVWAGKTVNMAAKLASLADSSMLVSDRYFSNLKDVKAVKSCGCNGSAGATYLWSKVDVSENSLFDFNTAYKLDSAWCTVHGKQYCEDLLAIDKK